MGADCPSSFLGMVEGGVVRPSPSSWTKMSFAKCSRKFGNIAPFQVRGEERLGGESILV